MLTWTEENGRRPVHRRIRIPLAKYLGTYRTKSHPMQCRLIVLILFVIRLCIYMHQCTRVPSAMLYLDFYNYTDHQNVFNLYYSLCVHVAIITFGSVALAYNGIIWQHTDSHKLVCIFFGNSCGCYGHFLQLVETIFYKPVHNRIVVYYVEDLRTEG